MRLADKLVSAFYGIGFATIGIVVIFGSIIPGDWIYWVVGTGYGLMLLNMFLYPFIFTRKYREKENGGIERIGPTRRIN